MSIAAKLDRYANVLVIGVLLSVLPLAAVNFLMG
jgi:hypothetical protein